MTRRSNQDIERHYFRQFMVHFPVPAGAPLYGDKPDVILDGELRIGVEIANLYLADGHDPTSEQRQRSLRKDVLSRAQARYVAAGGKQIELSVTFDTAQPIRDRSSLATKLATVAQSIDKMPVGMVNRAHFAGMPEVWSIYHNPNEYPDATWRAVQVYSVPLLSLSRISKILDEKHQKLSSYESCDAYWLLLVVDFADFAQDQDIEWPDSGVTLSTKFEKVIIYKPQFGSWTIVPTRYDG